MSRHAKQAALIILASLATAACGQQATFHTPARGGTRSSASTSTSSSIQARQVAAAARVQALVFAHGYARHLDGELAASALPAATASARAQAGPALPPFTRAGDLHVTSLNALAGSRYVATLQDRTHRFAVALTVTRVRGRAIVVGVLAPDLDSILTSHTPAIVPPAGSGPARQAAQTFLAGYLPWLYGRGGLAAIRGGAPALIAELKAHPRRIPATLQGLHPRLAALGMQTASAGWRALANVTDGHQTYELALALTCDHEQWRVTTVQLP